MDSEADVSYTNSKAASIATHGAAAGTLGQPRRSGNTNIYLFLPTSNDILYRLLFASINIDLMSFVSVPCYRLSRRWSGGQRLLL